jgi:hypothetical protein
MSANYMHDAFKHHDSCRECIRSTTLFHFSLCFISPAHWSLRLERGHVFRSTLNGASGAVGTRISGWILNLIILFLRSFIHIASNFLCCLWKFEHISDFLCILLRITHEPLVARVRRSVIWMLDEFYQTRSHLYSHLQHFFHCRPATPCMSVPEIKK